jgi:hypothetical protein
VDFQMLEDGDRVFGETASEPHSHDDPLKAYAHAGHSHSPMVTKAKAAEKPHSHVALDAFVEMVGEWHAKQNTAGVIDPNSGGNAVYLAPGLRLTVDNWAGYVSVGVPVAVDYNGIQATPAWRVLAGASVVLGPK